MNNLLERIKADIRRRMPAAVHDQVAAFESCLSLIERHEQSENALEFSVACVPVPQPRARSGAFGGHHYTPGKAIGAFKKQVLWEYRKAAGQDVKPYAGPVFVTIDAFFDRPKELLKKSSPSDAVLMIKKPDGDNIEKAVLDALTASTELKSAKKKLGDELLGFPWIDDSQVHIDGVRRWIVAKGAQPGVIVRITNGENVPCYPPPKCTSHQRQITRS